MRLSPNAQASLQDSPPVLWLECDFGLDSLASAPAISPDGQTVYVAVSSNELNLWSLIVYSWPAWLGVFTGFAVLVLLWRALRVWRRPQLRGRWHCRRCNYDLGPISIPASGTRCSECGRAYEKTSPRAGAGWARRLRWPIVIASVPIAVCGVAAWLQPPRMSSLNERWWWPAPGLGDWLTRQKADWQASIGYEPLPGSRLFAFDLRDRSRRFLCPVDYVIDAPVVSPSGQLIALTTRRPNASGYNMGGGLVVARADGGVVLDTVVGKRFTNGFESGARCAFEPGEQTVVIGGVDRKDSVLFRVDVRTGNPTVILREPVDAKRLSSRGEVLRRWYALSDDASIAVSGPYVNAVGPDSKTVVHDLASGTSRELPGTPAGFEPYRSLSSDGRVFVSSTGERQSIFAWNTLTAERMDDDPLSMESAAFRSGSLRRFANDLSGRLRGDTGNLRSLWSIDKSFDYLSNFTSDAADQHAAVVVVEVVPGARNPAFKYLLRVYKLTPPPPPP